MSQFFTIAVASDVYGGSNKVQMIDFGGTVRALMSKRGLSVRAMSDASKLNKDTVNEVMKSPLPPSRERTLAGIEKALGVNRDILFRMAAVGYDGSTASDLRARIVERLQGLSVDDLAMVHATVVQHQERGSAHPMDADIDEVFGPEGAEGGKSSEQRKPDQSGEARA